MRVIENDYLDFARDTPNAKRISYNDKDGRRTKTEEDKEDNVSVRQRNYNIATERERERGRERMNNPRKEHGCCSHRHGDIAFEYTLCTCYQPFKTRYFPP